MKVQMDSCKITMENGTVLHLTYYLLSDGERFGVEIRCRDGDAESADSISDLTGNRVRAEELIRMLCRGSVTPLSLRDVLYDWICTI